MRYLIICDNFSGPLIPIAHWLNAQQDSETLLASDRIRYPVGIKKIILKLSQSKSTHEDSLDYAADIIQKAKYAKKIFQNIKESGFYPDKIFMFSISGISLAASELFADAQKIIFLEAERKYNQQKAQALAALRNQLILDADFAFSFSSKLITELPKALQSGVRLAPLFVDPQFYPESAEKPLTVFYLKNLEPEAFKHWLEIAVHHSQQGNTAIFLPNNHEAKKLQDKLKAPQIWLGSSPALDNARKIFSQCGLFISHGEELSYDMLAAMSCGACAASSSRHKLLAPNEDYLLFDEDGKLSTSPEELQRIGEAGRKTVRDSFAADRLIPEMLKDIFEAKSA